MTATPLIPRHTFFSNPDHMSVQISPDGRWLTHVAPVEGVLNLWIAPFDAPDKAIPLTHDKGRGIRSYGWTYTGAHLVYQQDQEGDENWRIFSLNVESKELVALSPAGAVHASIQAVGKISPDEILLGLNDRDPSYHDVWRVNVRTGERTLIYQNDLYAGFVCDENLRLRFAFQTLPDGGGSYLHMDDAHAVTPFLTLSPEDVLTTSVLGFNKKEDSLYMLDSRGRDTAALTLYDLATGKSTLLAQDARADMEDFLVHPQTKELWAAAANYERKNWQFFKDDVARDVAYLQSLQEGDVEITGMTQTGDRWVVVFAQDRASALYYTFDRTTRQARFLFSNRKALDGLPLARLHPRVIRARDGLPLVSYLTLPVESDPENAGRPSKPLPLVLEVHGGPRARERWGYNPLHQWLANRGYAVLSVNYRSSVGFGKAFIKAGNGQWARQMHEDLLDAVDWAIKEGITQKDKVCIMGGSYGGYAALVGLAMTPDVFACGIDIVGPSNLETLVASIPPYWKPALDMMRVMIGADPTTPEGRAFLKERSPLTYHENICKPLLIAQGANDPRVKKAEADQIVAALEAKKIPVTYVLYPDEGHGFLRPENRLSFYAVVEAFLAQVLGGRVQEVGQDFEGSAATFLAGAHLIGEVTPRAVVSEPLA